MGAVEERGGGGEEADDAADEGGAERAQEDAAEGGVGGAGEAAQAEAALDAGVEPQFRFSVVGESRSSTFLNEAKRENDISFN